MTEGVSLHSESNCARLGCEEAAERPGSAPPPRPSFRSSRTGRGRSAAGPAAPPETGHPGAQ